MTGISYFMVYFLSIEPPREKEPPSPVLEKRVVRSLSPPSFPSSTEHF